MLSIREFDTGITLGIGTFGRVKIARHKASGTHCAIKILKKCELIRPKYVRHLMEERDILSGLNHPFIIKMHATFHDPRYIYMVFEFIQGGEMSTQIRSSVKKLGSEAAKFYIGSLVLAMEYLHSKSIAYRDLKPENVLIDDEGYVKLCDFGFAKKIDNVTYTVCGTAEYLAPEIITKEGHGKSVDWWALGILMYESLTGQVPFRAAGAMDTFQTVLNGKLVFPRKFGCTRAKDLIRNLLQRDVKMRYGSGDVGVESIKSSDWFKFFDFNSLAERRLDAPWVPRTRNASDTSNFRRYAEPTRAQNSRVRALDPKDDPFTNFSIHAMPIAV